MISTTMLSSPSFMRPSGLQHSHGFSGRTIRPVITCCLCAEHFTLYHCCSKCREVATPCLDFVSSSAGNSESTLCVPNSLSTSVFCIDFKISIKGQLISGPNFITLSFGAGRTLLQHNRGAPGKGSAMDLPSGLSGFSFGFPHCWGLEVQDTSSDEFT